MYTKEQLEQYEYFKGLDMEYVLDALTGCVSRGYILGLTKYLIEKKEPFAFAIIDLDNFKLINDNYGHKVGDECLNKIIDSFINYIGNNGIVGRYGGDEFIVVYLNDNPTYDNVHAFFTDIYHAKQCVRKSYDLGDIRLFVTATTGVASYPYDATTFDDLFQKADKALYRGKSKGRNCYIVYVDEKHRDIDVHRKDTSYLPDMFTALTKDIDLRDSLEGNTRIILDRLVKVVSATDCIVVYNDLCVESIISHCGRSVKKPTTDDFSILFDNDVDYIVSNQLKDYKMKSPGINRYMTATNTQSIMAFKIGFTKTSGYLAIMENRLLRVWQEREVALALYVAKLLSVISEFGNKK